MNNELQLNDSDKPGTIQRLGTIQSVDTGNIAIQIDKEDVLNNLQINQLLCIRSINTSQTTIAIINKIMRRGIENKEEDNEDVTVENLIKANLIGTFFDKQGSDSNVFKRTLKTVPSIGADCFLLDGENLVCFMMSISKQSEDNLKIGVYTLQDDSIAYLDGNKFFQRHAIVVGSTGSGKSWTIANILEQAANLKSVNNIVFDLHGEYQPLKDLENTTTLKIAGPSDNEEKEDLIFLPYWLLSYEEIEAMILDRSDQNAPNQARVLFDTIIEQKRENLDENNAEQKTILDNFTIDSPIPYDLNKVIKNLETLNNEDIPTGEIYKTGDKQGQKKTTKGPFYDKLTRFIQRLKSKKSDKRLNFIFNSSQSLQEYNWFEDLIKKLMSFENEKAGSKIIDFSEVPSDILPLIAGLVARVIFSVQQWTEKENRHPIALFCDEAHLYIPQNPKDSVENKGLYNFERIAKEGRKYGVALIVISQRPSDVNKTVLSQCSNFIAMRLSNPDDQNVIKRLFPDNLGGFAELLPILDIGEGLIVGDACLLPSRIKINEPTKKPDSATIDFWTEWGKEKKENALSEAIRCLRQQGKIRTTQDQ